MLLISASITAWWFSYQAGLTTIYNDAMAHLNIARAVLDGKQPGLAQLGSIWLPLNHILFLTLIWNNWAWHSGFAGSFFSMLAYIFSAIGIYAIIDELTGNLWASMIGAGAFALNPNILYLQTTPLTEPLYLVFFIFSVLFLIKFEKTDNLRYLLLMGIFGLFQALTRYDGWFVVFVEGLALISHQKFARKLSFQEILGKFFIFAMPIAFGVIVWLVWNALIFGNPLYFIFGPSSAHAQQIVIQSQDGLITKGNLGLSLLAYWYALSANTGVYLVALAALGIAAFLATKNTIGDFKNRLAILLLFLAPVIFNVIALYFGFSILNLPQLNWHPTANVAQYFNVRYGILILPLVAVFVGLLAAKLSERAFVVLVALAIIAQSLLIWQQGPM